MPTKWLACLAMALGLAGCTPAGVQPASAREVESVEQVMHPSGPTIRHEWRLAESRTLMRVRIIHARSGQALVGQARLQKTARSSWEITTGNGQTVPLDLRKNGEPLARFTETGALWTVRVERAHWPAERAGVATEDEPALDLWLQRQPAD